jgi:hypothetical protein
MQWLTNTIADGYDWVMRRIAQRAMAQAYQDGQIKALRTALIEFSKARNEDHQLMLMEMRSIGSGMNFNDADPKVAYELGKQVATEIIQRRIK